MENWPCSAESANGNAAAIRICPVSSIPYFRMCLTAEKRQFERLRRRWREIIKIILKGIRCGSDSRRLGRRPVARSCQHGNEPVGYIKGGEFREMSWPAERRATYRSDKAEQKYSTWVRGTSVPSEGSWGPHDSFGIFISSFKCSTFQ
jgi:hypothetical protein